MPIIEDADLTTVSTSFDPIPEETYDCVIYAVEYNDEDKAKPLVIVKNRVDMPGTEFHAREVWDYIYLRQNDGKPNEMSRRQLKRYYEAVLGEVAANTQKPRTEDLVNGRVRLFVEINEYFPKEELKKPEAMREKKKNNKIKRIFPAS